MLTLVIILFLFYFEALVASGDECGLRQIICKTSKYRSIDGSCNNLNNPNWGTIFSVYDRLLPPKYGDAIHAFPRALSGNDLPNARKMTSKIYVEGFVEDISNYTLVAMQYGQVLTHDMSLTYLPLSPLGCCTRTLQFLPNAPKECASIRIPDDDPHYSHINATCISMPRTKTNTDLNCSRSLSHAEQVNNANNYVDLSIIYGHTNEVHESLRTYKDGTLLMDKRNNYEWLPSSRGTCIGNLNSNEICYRSGDVRTNQNPQLTLLQTVWARNHNLLARELQKINPQWDDARLFEEARRINIAEHQQISFYELLPIYMGRKNLEAKNIIRKTNGFVNDYDKTQRPHVYNEHAQAAFRQFHSMISGKLSLVNPSGCPYDSIVLRDYISRPKPLETANLFDGLIRGFTTQPSMGSDIYYDFDFTTSFNLLSERFGMDVKSIDIHRARDHGLASYNDMRKYCGLPKATTFEAFLDVMNKDKLDLLKQFYEKPDDVDLIVGGSMERNEPGTLVGPTFLCILYKQFYRSRISDRFWFENKATGLTLKQLNEIRKYTVSKLLCDNGNEITHMQKRGFEVVSNQNPRVPCSQIPGPNIQFWKE